MFLEHPFERLLRFSVRGRRLFIRRERGIVELNHMKSDIRIVRFLLTICLLALGSFLHLLAV